MTTLRKWTVEIFIDEHEDTQLNHAEARLHTNDDTHLVGHGTARRHDEHPEVAEISDELAVARALTDLSRQLVRAFRGDLEDLTHHRPVVPGATEDATITRSMS